MPSFDVVSSLDMQEIDNAVNMVKRDINNRYDFKGSTSSITLNKNDNNILIKGDNDYHINTIVDMLENRSISRKVSIKTYIYIYKTQIYVLKTHIYVSHMCVLKNIYIIPLIFLLG